MSNKQSEGFTLVELLIVIVVIAILAAISIVAYNGVQNRAKTSSGQQLASTIAKKAEIYNTLMGSYAPDRQHLNMSSPGGSVPQSPIEARPDDPNSFVNLNAQPPTDETFGRDAAIDGTRVAYRACPSGSYSTVPRTGGIVYYWDYMLDNRAEVTFGAGC